MDISISLRRELRQAIDELCERFGALAARELAAEFEKHPYSAISNAERGGYIVNHEIFKIVTQRKLRADGSPRTRKRARKKAVGKPCPLCNELIHEDEVTERHHRFYDGRPTEVVHTSCHKKLQPH